MKEAIRQAKKAAALGDVPIGCVIVYQDKIIGRGYNRRMADKTVLAHAEIIAMRKACKKMGDWRLEECELYVTLEPCPMCAGAILHARLDQVVFGTRDPKGGAVRSMEEMFALPYHWKPEVYEGLLQAECAGKLTNFFRMLRAKKKQAQQK